jgi:hypothetical protein
VLSLFSGDAAQNILSFYGFSSDRTQTLTSMHNFSSTLKLLARREGALTLMETYFQMRQRILGERHHDTQSSLGTLNGWRAERSDDDLFLSLSTQLAGGIVLKGLATMLRLLALCHSEHVGTSGGVILA